MSYTVSFLQHPAVITESSRLAQIQERRMESPSQDEKNVKEFVDMLKNCHMCNMIKSGQGVKEDNSQWISFGLWHDKRTIHTTAYGKCFLDPAYKEQAFCVAPRAGSLPRAFHHIWWLSLSLRSVFRNLLSPRVKPNSPLSVLLEKICIHPPLN